jgi:hypothetical protein
MADINTARAASKAAIEQLIASPARCGPACAAPRAHGACSGTALHLMD